MPKPTFVRVKDKNSKHEYTVATVAVRAHHELIDKPAVDPVGRPLPPKPHVSKGGTRRKSPAPVAPTIEPDAPADEQKEG